MEGLARIIPSQPLCFGAAKPASGGKIRAPRFASAKSSRKPLNRFRKTYPNGRTRVGACILANTIGNAVANGISGGSDTSAQGQAGNGSGGPTNLLAQVPAEDGGDAGTIVVTAPKSSSSGDGIVDPPFGSVQIWQIPRGSKIIPVMRQAGHTFTDSAITAEEHNIGLSLVVNAEQYNLNGGSAPGGYTFGDLMGYPGSISDTQPIGEVIQNGHIVTGTSSPDTFFISEMTNAAGDVNYNFGKGNPPADSTTAFGGGIPLIIDDLKYGSTNIYSPGVSGPLTGDPHVSLDDLEQRSNSGFAWYANKPDGGASIGKVIVAYNDSSDQLAIAVQPDGAANGKTLSEIRDHLAQMGYNNAIAFDGSSSTTLVMWNAVMIAPANYKNSTINVGIGVKTPWHP